MPPTIAIIAAGEMGSALAHRLSKSGCAIVTNLDGRSEATKRRAREAGMQNVPFADLPIYANFVLSILPPGEAVDLAQRFLSAWEAADSNKVVRDVIYADCNAVSPETVKAIAAPYAERNIRFIDAGIIGLPPREDYDPTIYVAADLKDDSALHAFEALGRYGLKVTTLRGDSVGVGDASALKMSYAVPSFFVFTIDHRTNSYFLV